MFPKRKTMLYFSPHQDDELLSMGVDICDSVSKKYDVHVILCTDGSKSGVREKLKDGKHCRKHEGLHVYELSNEDFIRARDCEFRDSCCALGVDPSNIHIPEKRDMDGSLSVNNAEKLIKQYLSRYGENAVVCTISPNNGSTQHRDHKALGKAVDNLLNQGVIKEAKFFIETYLFNKIKENPRLIPIDPTIKNASAHAKENIKKAISAYSYWNPEVQRYAVGYHSVTTEFDNFLKNRDSYYYVKKNPKAMSLLDRLEYRHKKYLKLYKQRQLYYSMSNCDQPNLGALKLVHIQARDADGYRDFCFQYDVKVNDKNVQRISDGSSFWCLVSNDRTVVSTGWLAYKQHFYIGETDYGFDMNTSQTAILFDFVTKPEHRGNGYYGLLLKSIVHDSEGPERYIIYTSPDNESSSRGILKAGFHYDGALSAADNSMKPYLRKAGFSSIMRKNQLWGLRIVP